MKLPVVLHCSATREDHGGVQSILAFHQARDPGLGFDPRFVSFFDRTVTWPGDCSSLAGHGWETVGALRRHFGRAARARATDVAIYHDAWGLDWFAPLDGAARRVVFLHTELPNLDELVLKSAPQADGFLSVSHAMADRVRRLVPDFPPERILGLEYFVDPPPALARREIAVAPEAAPIRLGYAGRIRLAQKRLDRLPALLAELDRRGVDYVFEVMGDGPYEPELRRRVAGHARVKFLGWRDGDAYWETVATWQALVIFSDFEGFSRAGMEAMMGGVVPVYPQFSPAGAELLGPLSAHGLYPVGDMAAAANRIAGLAALGPEQRARLGRQAREHLAAHSPDNYLASYRSFLRDLLAAPPRARPVPPPAWHNWMLLGLYTRLFPHRF